MVWHRTIKTLIFVLFINNCYAKQNKKPRVFKIIEKNNKIVLENDDNSGYNPKELLKFVQKHADVEYYVKNILNKNALGKYPDGIHHLGKKRILAKRIVPPSQKTSDFIYDKQYETYFKPLVKVHKVKKMEKQDADIGVLSDSSSSSDESEQNIQNYGTNDYSTQNNRDLLNVIIPKEKKVTQNINKNQHNMRMSIEEEGARFLKDLQEMAHVLKDKRQKKIIKDRISVIVQELEDLHAILFDLVTKPHNLREGSAENLVPMVNTIDIPSPHFDIDAKIDAFEEEHKAPRKIPVHIPHNPLWNFWTVRQTTELLSITIGLVDKLPLALTDFGR